MSPWAPPLTRRLTERDAWTRRARRFHRQHGSWCRLCERRDWRWGPFTFRARLEVHHCDGRGYRSQVGYEDDTELMILCVRCHARITRRHNLLARQRGHRMSNPATEGYSHDIRQATDQAHPRYFRRAIWRMLTGVQH